MSARRVPTPTVRGAPRALGLLVASATLLLGAACSSASASDADLHPDSPEADTAPLATGPALVVALGPSAGAVAPLIEVDETPPVLVIISPLPNSQVDASTFVFEGFSEPGAIVAAGEITTVAEDNGRWSLALSLDEGQNTAVLTSTDAAGNEIEKVVTVHFEQPKPVVLEPLKEEHDPKPEPKEEYEPKPEPTQVKEPNKDFTAWTKFGICTVEPFQKTGGEGSKDTDVLTKFKGTGIPGSTVTVISPYGGGLVEVDDSGYWWIKVEFSDGATEAEFTAIVTNGDHQARFRCGAI